MVVKAYGAYAGDKPLEPIDITRREPGADDVQIAIAYCGVCHSDLHQVRSEWGGTVYPCVPGHEIVGHVTAVGANVSKFKVGDTVEAKFTGMDRKGRSLQLSIRAKDEEDLQSTLDEYQSATGGTTKLGALLKEQLNR